jgi:hypothetical protein
MDSNILGCFPRILLFDCFIVRLLGIKKAAQINMSSLLLVDSNRLEL